MALGSQASASWQRLLGGLYAQAYGLAQRPAASSYLNGALPQVEASTTGWGHADAFPSLSFTDPTVIVAVPGTNTLLVGSQEGLIESFVNSASTTTKTVFLDLTAVTQAREGCGLMGLAFHPEYGTPGSPNRGYIYLHYNYSPAPNNSPSGPDETPQYNRVSRFTVPDGASAADLASEQVLINQYDRHLWHSGGALFFGADGFLYVSAGDEGDNNDRYLRGGKIDGGLFSGVLRIDVDRNASKSHPIRRQPTSGETPPNGWPASFTQNYYIPNDNPWLDVNGSVLEEYFAVGFRNPHRMTYDATSNRIWLGDVGQSTREEVDIVEKGGNYQWSYGEGTVTGPHAKPTAIVGTDKPPVFDYPHANGYTCVIGGYVYRGTEFAAYLTGKYLFGDNGTSRIRAMTYDGTASPEVFELTTLPHGGGETTGMSTFGLDNNNEILMACAGPDVKIYKLTKASGGQDPPALLSQTGAFTDLATLTPSASLIPYTVNAPLWSDNAVKSRWMSVPDGATVDYSNTGAWAFPIGTVFVKHFELPINDSNPALRKRLETRFLVHASDGSYYGLTYKWRADNSDADLLPGGLNEAVTITTPIGTRQQTWSYPSRQDCIVCHNSNAGSVLGARTCQLNGDFAYTAATDNQLRTLNHIGLFTDALVEGSIAALPKSANIHDNSAALELRVRSYLDANCSHCHRPSGVKANFDARLETPLAAQGLIRGIVADPLGISGAKLIVPSDIGRSMIRHRDNLLGTNQMPPLARNTVDTDYITVLTQWINSLPPTYTLPVFIGNQSEGNSTDTITDNSGSFINANQFTATSDGSLTEIHAKVGAITGSYRCAIYSDSGGNASTFLRATNTLTNVSAGWQTFALTSALPITSSTAYWIGIWSDDVNARVHMDTGGNLHWAAYPFGTWPTTVNLAGTSNATYCIYATGPGSIGKSAPPRGIISGSYSWQAPITVPGGKFTISGQPKGLSINATTGEVYGTPDASGTFTVKITQTLGKTVSTQSFTIIVDAFPAGLAGNYAGLVDRNASNGDLGGSLALTVGSSGVLTGRLFHAATSYPLTGRLIASSDADPTYTLTIARKGKTSLLLTLSIARATATISGNVSGAGISARHEIIVPPGTANSSNTLNAILRPPAGDLTTPRGTGWLRLTQSVISGKASVSASGKLSDGTVLTFAASICDNLDAPLRSVLYGGKGSIQGTTRVTASPFAIWPPRYFLAGTLDRKKLSPTSSSDYSYASIAQTLTVSGQTYVQPNAGLTLLNNNDTSDNAKLAFTEGGIASAAQGASADQTFHLTAAHKAIFGNASINPCGVTLAIDASKGTFSGSLKIKDGATRRTVKYEGLFIGGQGEGFFTLPQLPLTKTSPVLSGKVEVKAP